jgi:NAD(P)-dependent dehydrogenase (short-subunit alcohol dehydrogenase family)
MKSFKQKEILVTGAASGIGRATALAFARQGANLWLSDVNEEGLARTAELIREAGGTARTLVCDVSDRDAVQAMADQVHEQIEALDILVNNAGIGSAGRFLDVSPETWEKVMDINLMGVVHGCQAFLPAMVKRGKGGHVVNTASAAAFLASPEMPVYAASKFAVLGLSESLRADMAGHKIGVSAICPGIINTGIVRNTIMEGAMGEGDIKDKVVSFYEKRNYTADKVADAVLRAVRRNTAVQPVSPEAWGMYLGKRLAPALLGRITQAQLPFLKSSDSRE